MQPQSTESSPPVPQVLKPAATTVPVVSLAVSEGYVGPACHSPYVMGIDARSVSTSLVLPYFMTYNSAADCLNNVSKEDGTVRILKLELTPTL